MMTVFGLMTFSPYHQPASVTKLRTLLDASKKWSVPTVEMMCNTRAIPKSVIHAAGRMFLNDIRRKKRAIDIGFCRIGSSVWQKIGLPYSQNETPSGISLLIPKP